LGEKGEGRENVRNALEIGPEKILAPGSKGVTTKKKEREKKRGGGWLRGVVQIKKRK